MGSETYLDFCFVEKTPAPLGKKINQMFEELFQKQRLSWYLDEKVVADAEVVVAEIKGMSRWHSEDEFIDYLEKNAPEEFWSLLYGYQFVFYR